MCFSAAGEVGNNNVKIHEIIRCLLIHGEAGVQPTLN